MPSSSEQAPIHPHQVEIAGLDRQEEGSRFRSSGNKRGKTRRKHEVERENERQEAASAAALNALIPSPPIPYPDQIPSYPDTAPRNTIKSPVLPALDGFSNINSQNNTGSHIGDWTRSAVLGQSPPNGFGNGVSPGGSPPGTVLQRDQHRGGFSHASPPASPSAAYRQLVRPSHGYQSFGDYLGSSPVHPGPVLIRSPNDMYTAAPHQPQAHFFGAPEIDFSRDRPRTENMRIPEARCCMFDSLASAGDDGQRAIKDILLVGFEKRMDVYSIGRSKPTHIGCLEGLRGTVLGAKILPAPSRHDPLRSFRPLVAVVINSIYEPPKPEADHRPGTSHSHDSEFDTSGSMLQALYATDPSTTGRPIQFQTTVEVYSLRANKNLATLLRSSNVNAESSQDYQFSSSNPQGAGFTVQASSKFIVIGSGMSGEVFVFDVGSGGSDDVPAAFKCLGKVWTRTSQERSRSLSVSSDSSDPEKPSSKSPQRSDRLGTPIFDLSHRWLAVVPPSASSQKTIRAIVTGNRSPQKVPGLTSHTAPSEPAITCELDTPEAESLFNKVARDVTQELMKGARWVGGQGIQAWNNYWSKPPDRNNGTSPNSYSVRPSSMPQGQPSFPPTHANDLLSSRKRSQPISVSLLDLEKLMDGQRLKPDKALQPVATFSVTNGCSFVSFAPSGLHILTASTKGDVQQVWSLLRMVHGEAAHGTDRNAEGRGPFVREVKRFTRLTEASIVDVVWAHPRGEKLAIITDRGTVHIHDIPTMAFQWPPPRRILKSNTPDANTTKPSPSESMPDTTIRSEQAESRFGAAFNMVTGRTQPLFAAVRGRPVSTGSTLAGWRGLTLPAGAGATGSKAVSAGFNKSIGAATGTVHSLRHLGENRLSLPASFTPVAPRCVMWLGGRNQGFIAAVGGEVIKIHSVTKSTNPKAGRRRSSVFASRPVQFSIAIPTNASRKPYVGSRGAFENEQPALSASPNRLWQPLPQSHQQKSRSRAPHPLSCAEIETNAPYQPFHTDRRVAFSLHHDDDDGDTSESQDSSSLWVFGESIPATKVSMCPHTTDDDARAAQSQATPLENLISLEGNEEEGQQFVVTTRRKRTKERATSEGVEESDFFEYGCEMVDFAEDRV